MTIYLWNLYKSPMTFKEAVFKRKPSIMSLRIAQGADINKLHLGGMYDDFDTPLYHILCIGRSNTVVTLLNILLTAGADARVARLSWVDNNPVILMTLIKNGFRKLRILNEALYWGQVKMASIMLTFSDVIPNQPWRDKSSHGLYYSFNNNNKRTRHR